MTQFQAGRTRFTRVGSNVHRSLPYYLGLVLATALMLSLVPVVHTRAQKQKEKSLNSLIGLLDEASGLAKGDGVRSDLKQAEQAVIRANQGQASGKDVAGNLETARVLLRKILDDPRGESADFQNRIAAALKLSNVIAAGPDDQPQKAIGVFGGMTRQPTAQPTPKATPRDCESPEAPLTCDGEPRNGGGPSYPVSPLHGRFRVTLNGFMVNHQTNQGLWAAWDAVRFYPRVATVDASGQVSMSYGRFFTTAIGRSEPHVIQGGTASASGGLRTGDGFPTQTPWHRTVPYTTGADATIPPTLYFDGELVQNNGATVIIPSIWEVDDRSELHLDEDYQSSLDSGSGQMGRVVTTMIRGPQPLTLESYLRPGSSVGLWNSMLLSIGVPQNRPIGMQAANDQFGFTPQVLILTFNSAEYMSRTNFGSGVGVVPVRYVDDPRFAGDYTLYFQVERLF